MLFRTRFARFSSALATSVAFLALTLAPPALAAAGPASDASAPAAEGGPAPTPTAPADPEGTDAQTPDTSTPTPAAAPAEIRSIEAAPAPAPASSEPTDWNAYDAQKTTTSAGPPPPSAGAPPPPSTPPRVRRRRSRRGLGMMISGYSAFFGIWLVTAIAGAATFDSAGENFLDDADAQRRRAVGRRLMIPVGGPYAAAFVTDTATGALFSVISGLAQTATLTLGIVGTVIYAKHRRAVRQVEVGAAPTLGGSMLHLRMRF